MRRAIIQDRQLEGTEERDPIRHFVLVAADAASSGLKSPALATEMTPQMFLFRMRGAIVTKCAAREMARSKIR